MKIIFFSVFILFFLTPGCALESEPFKGFDFPPLGEIKIPDYQRFELDNGMVVYLMEDNRFPIVNFQAILPVGTIQDSEDKLGLAEITMEVLRSGGTKDLSGDKIDQKLERVGASISTGISRDAASISGYSLKGDFSQVLKIARDILRQPAFSKDKLHLSRINKMAEIARRDDRARGIANREIKRLVYGKNHPYARIIEADTIANISREDVVGFYQNHFGPDGIVLAVWGDFSRQKMLENIKDYFGGWPRKNLPGLPGIEVSGKEKGVLEFYTKSDLTQSYVVLGHLGITRDDPDYFTCLVLSQILGSGWNSRFMRYLRQEEALAYSVYALHAAEYAYPGLFIAQAQTRLERTQQALGSMLREIERIRKEEVLDDELKSAKEAVLNSSLFLFDTPDKIISRLVRYEYYGYPKDYIDKLLEGVKAVTAEDLLEAAKRHLRPEELSLLIVTTPEKEEELKNSLKEEQLPFL